PETGSAMTTRHEQALDRSALKGLDALRLSELDKSLPAAADGLTKAEFLATSPRLSAFTTPVLTLDAAAIDENLATMAAWCSDHGVELPPHGKTTMSPTFWERQMRSGAWGITLATFSQLRIAVRFGVPRIQLANALV